MNTRKINITTTYFSGKDILTLQFPTKINIYKYIYIYIYIYILQIKK